MHKASPCGQLVVQLAKTRLRQPQTQLSRARLAEDTVASQRPWPAPERNGFALLKRHKQRAMQQQRPSQASN
eukprot:scaffold382519_cov43-Prasinocladus_malaysianus.AAC.1